MQNSMYSTETWIMKINKKETKGYAAAQNPDTEDNKDTVAITEDKAEEQEV